MILVKIRLPTVIDNLLIEKVQVKKMTRSQYTEVMIKHGISMCCHRLKGVNYLNEHGLSVRISHVCDHVGRYCGKICPKQNWELPRENMHLAYRNEYSKRKYDRRCVVCNEESIWGSFVRWRRRSVRNRLSWKRLIVKICLVESIY